MKRLLVFFTLLFLYLLHYDFWLWQRPEVVLGLPVGLLYHFAYCLVVSIILALLIPFAWRRPLSAE